MRCLLISDENWTFLDQFKFVRLLGKQPINAIDDPELNEIFLAWETIEDQWGTRFWLQMQELTPYEDPAFSAWRVWREIVPRPESPEAAVAFLLGIAQREIERLQELIVDLEEIEGDDALELAEQASFCASDAAERLRRFQTARTRELLRTIDLLAKLRKADAPKPEKKATKEPNPPAAPKPARRPLVLPLRPDRNPCRRRHDRLPGEAARSGRTAVAKSKNRRERTHFGAALDPRNTSPKRERGKRLREVRQAAGRGRFEIHPRLHSRACIGEGAGGGPGRDRMGLMAVRNLIPSRGESGRYNPTCQDARLLTLRLQTAPLAFRSVVG